MISRTRTTKPRFQLILIKPSHYDNDGYVVQWLRSTMPSNSLAAVFSLANGAAERQLLGPDMPIDVLAMDETNTRVKPKDIARRIADNGGLGFVGIVGVQSNEFPRAVDIARPLREAGVQVLIGGFHVSGCLAMLNELPDDIKEAQATRRVDLSPARPRKASMKSSCDAARRELQAALQSHEGSAGHRRHRRAAVPAQRLHRAHHRQRDELRCRPRLPVPVLVLHHHQRAGPQVALSLRRTMSRRSSA